MPAWPAFQSNLMQHYSHFQWQVHDHYEEILYEGDGWLHLKSVWLHIIFDEQHKFHPIFLFFVCLIVLIFHKIYFSAFLDFPSFTCFSGIHFLTTLAGIGFPF